MAFIHRKLKYESSNLNLTEICKSFCNLIDNQGYCPISCNSCPTICYHQNPSPPTTPPPTTFSLYKTKSPKLSTPLTISLVLIATTFSLFCSYTIYRYCTHRRRRRRRTETQTEQTDGTVFDHPIWHIRTIGLQQSIINSITVCKYKRSDGVVEGTECSVCLNEFQEDETLRLLPNCKHAFHIPCIDTWLRSHTNCPMCRAGIVPGSPSPEQSIDDSGVLEETQMGIADNNGELGGEREDEACELRIGTEEFENGRSVSVDEVQLQLQPMRRSVSLDCLSASMISVDIANDLQAQSDVNTNTQLVKLNESEMGVVSKRLDVNQSLLRLVGSSSIGRSLQRGPNLIKRSMSCSGKVLVSRYSQSQTSVLPP